MDFLAYQRAFTAHVRDPRNVARPKGVPARRMKVYSDLLYNNMEGFLLSCFPVCRRILGKRRWDRMVRAFFRDHVCHTPYCRRIPEEFLQYLQSAPQALAEYPPFLPELAHYEWIELELDTSDRDADTPRFDPAGDLMAGRPLLNPVLRVLAYRWPVHRLSPRYKPAEPPPEATFFLAFRNVDMQVRFILLNAASARLLNLLQTHPELSGDQSVTLLAQEMKLSPGDLAGYARTLVQDLHEQGAILGVTV